MTNILILKLTIAAVAISCAVGVFVFTPLLLIALAVHAGAWDAASLQWLGEPKVLFCLSGLALMEIAIDMIWGVNALAEFLHVPFKPAVASVISVALLGDEVGSLLAALMGAVPGAVAQLVNLKCKLSLRLIPGCNIPIAITGLVATIAITVASIGLVQSTVASKHVVAAPLVVTMAWRGK